jgi:hypothetical protein
MTFTYSPNLETLVSEIRFNTGDTAENLGPRPNNTNYSDEELVALLAKHDDDVARVTCIIFDTLAAEWSRYAISFTIGPRKEELHRISTRYEAKSREWAVAAGIASVNFSAGFKRAVNRADSEHTA